MAKNAHRCIVPACPNNIFVNPEATVYRFPVREERILKWISAISEFSSGLPPVDNAEEAQKYYTKFVCANHFLASDFTNEKRKKLNRYSVPSVFAKETASSHIMMTAECVVQPSATCFVTTLSPASPHVMPVKRVYSRSQCMEDVGVQNCVSDSLLDNSTFVPALSSTPNGLPKARCRLDMNVLGTSCCVENDSSEILAESLSDTTVRHAQKSAAFKVRKTCTLVKCFGASRVKDLTPRKQKLFRKVQLKVKAIKRTCESLRKQNLTFRNTIEAAEDVQLNKLKNLSPTVHHLLMSQLRCKKRKPKGRRWTLDEKIMSLTIYKRSPSCYSLLRHMLVLPSKKTLLTVLNKVPFKRGVDNRVFNFVKNSVSNMPDVDHHCVLMFDEISLKEHVQYCPKEDKIIGLVDNGSSRSGDLANYAMVFMVRGLRTKWKQPVACYFTRGGMKGEQLKGVIEEVLASCFDIGLKVVATICDMGTNNVSALKGLGAKFPDPLFRFQAYEIAVIFDPPHLLKCIRNMFLSHCVRGIKVRGDLPINGAAKWEHIEQMYEEEKKTVFRIAFKVTDAHVAPTPSERMRVSTAAQTMSHSVAAAIHSYIGRGTLPQDAIVTASFIADADELFDSVNGADRFPQGGKLLRCQVSASSPHVEYWQGKAKSMVHNWRFCEDPAADKRLKRERKRKSPPLKPGKRRSTVTHPPSQWGWITSINGILHVWNVLSEAGFTYLQPRALNQDPLENLFGLIRSYCGANHNPTISQFAGAFKTAVVNGLALKGLTGNCQADDAAILSDLREFLVSELKETENTDSVSTDEVEGKETCQDVLAEIESAVESGDLSVLSAAYVAGFIARKLLRTLNCDCCKRLLTGSSLDFCNTAIALKEYSHLSDSLTYPIQDLVAYVAKFAVVFDDFMVSNSHIDKVVEFMCQHAKNILPLSWLENSNCDHYDYLQNGIVKAAAEISVRWWCKRVNRNLVTSKRIKQQAKKMRILTHT